MKATIEQNQLLPLEKIYKLLGTSKLSGDQKLLQEVMTDCVQRNGEDWVKEHRQLCIDQWESL